MFSPVSQWTAHLRQSRLRLSYYILFPLRPFPAILLFSCLLSGCSSRNSLPYPARDDTLHSLQRHLIIPHPLPVMAWIPAQAISNTVRIYIEGDGKAWVRRGRPSSDPTPENRLVHYLMQEDPETDIAYLGRPCQYLQTPQCHSRIWTFERYSKPVVDLMNDSVDRIKKYGNYQQIELVGYSGGATIALLLAARRDDVLSVRTVAGNLDPAFTNKLHGVSGMPNAMNPLNYRKILSQVPQVHFYGSNDGIIPDKISQHYQQRVHETNCIIIRKVQATHYSGWAEQWQDLLKVSPECRNSSGI